MLCSFLSKHGREGPPLGLQDVGLSQQISQEAEAGLTVPCHELL